VFIYCAEIVSFLLCGFLQIRVKAQPLHDPSKKLQHNIQNEAATKIILIKLYFTNIYFTHYAIPPACSFYSTQLRYNAILDIKYNEFFELE